MTFDKVPKQYQVYTVIMRTKNEYDIDGYMYDELLNNMKGFVSLDNNTVINTLNISEIVKNNEQTKENVRRYKDKILEILKFNAITK